MAVKYVIPARRNSKGFPLKNRKLIDYTLSIIPENIIPDVIISTDDEEIIDKYKDIYSIHLRNPAYAFDTVSIKSTLENIGQDMKFENEFTVVMLYLTYPGRAWEDILNALNLFNESGSRSLLCKKTVKTHPYMCLQETGNNKGIQLKYHDFYRRQDYPKCFEISHFISIFKYEELHLLNSQLYNGDTYFMQIDDVVDVDYETDYLKFRGR